MTSAAINDLSGVNTYPGSKANGSKNSDLFDELAGSFQNAIDLAQGSGFANSDNKADKDVSGVSMKTENDTFDARNQAMSYAGSKGQKLSDSLKNASSINTANSKTTDAITNDTSSINDSKDVTEETSDVNKTNNASDKAAEKVEDTTKKVVKEIADKLDVSEEDVENAMEILGLSVVDLMDQSNMAMLVTELTADGDMSAMLTDENLFASIVDLTEMVTDMVTTTVEELADDLGLSFDETMTLIDEAIEYQGKEVVVTDALDENLEAVEKPVERETAATDKADTDDYSFTKGNVVSETNNELTRVSTSNLDQGAFENSQNDMSNDQAAVFNQVNEQQVQTVAPAETQYVAGTNVSTQEIIDQIADYVKVNAGPELSEVEMTLNPASLGNIHLQVAEKNGVITATITAQNESVRDALMVQAMVLKEELNEQGLKVEAVDVTVASHEFEENMQGETGENAKQLYEEQVQKNTRRRILINGLSDAEALLQSDEVSDADKVQIDMMARNGQSMDITV